MYMLHVCYIYLCMIILTFIPFLHCSNNVNTNHSISGGKLWQLFIVGKDVFVIVLTTYIYDDGIICFFILNWSTLACICHMGRIPGYSNI